MTATKTQQRKEFAESLRREMERRKGWTGRGAASQLARAVHAKPSLAASWLRGERIPSAGYLTRIMTVLGISATALEGLEIPDDSRAIPTAHGERILSPERSSSAAPSASVQELDGGALDVDPASVLAVLQRVPEEMQRAAIVRAFARGLDHQELHGSGLLRAVKGICAELDRLGFTAVAKEIKAELMNSVFEEISKQKPTR